MSEKSELILAVETHLRWINAPDPVYEYHFCDRKWRFDMAWPDRMAAIEVHGGTWVGGRHVTGTGFASDRQKMNSATLLGWKVIELTADMIEDQSDIPFIEGLLCAKQPFSVPKPRGRRK